jgi:dipeptidyl-peptidase-4
VEYPELAARTRRFTHGAPRAVSVSADGARVVFLRSAGPQDPVDRMWVYDVATRTERLVADPLALLSSAKAKLAGSGPDRDELPDHERALRERLRLTAAGIGSYATDQAGRTAVFPLAGRLFAVDLTHASTGQPGTAEGVTELPTVGPAVDPRPDPTGRRIAYVTNGTLRIIAPDGTDSMLAGEALNAHGGPSTVTWGLAEFIAAEEFGRFRGYWWAPDGQSVLAARVDDARVPRWHLHDPAEPAKAPTTLAYPYAGATNAEVSLHLLDLDGGWVDVHWDRETYPYLVAVHWSEGGGPLITVLRRLQQHGLVLAVDPRTGETQVHAELADPRWVEPIPGTPCHLGDGRVLVGGELAHDGYDARCLFADGTLLTPPSLYVRRICGRLGPEVNPADAQGTASAVGPATVPVGMPVSAGGVRARPGTAPGSAGAKAGPQPGSFADLLVEASEGEPSEQHLFRVRTSVGATGFEVRRLTNQAGWHVGVAGGDVLVIGSASLDHSGTQWTVYRGDAQVGTLTSLAASPPYQPRPALERVTDRRLPSGVLYPRQHVAGRRLPVLVDIYGGPARQEVLATRERWAARQWWADAGFAVVVVDNRGTPGVAPSFEKVIHRRMADLVLADQVEALTALAAKHPDLDLDRVGIRGWSYGGWLAALAVLRRPDIYHCGVAGAPVTDWTLYDTAYTERYLGLPDDGSEVYAHHSLLELAESLPDSPAEARPLLLIHGLVDDNVVAAHTLRLSSALLASGRPHSVIPLSGATHMAAAGIAERLLPLELDFLRRNLPS